MQVVRKANTKPYDQEKISHSLPAEIWVPLAWKDVSLPPQMVRARANMGDVGLQQMETANMGEIPSDLANPAWL